jgi:energy-coupling factor transport system permease protein
MTAYFDRPSPVHALDPRVKIAWSVAVSLLAVVLRQPLWLAGLFALTIAPWCLVRPPLARLRLLFVLVGTTVLGAMISQGFFYGFEPRTELLNLLPGLSLCREGVLYGAVVSLRLLSVLSAGALVVFTTYPSDLILALTRLRVPPSFAFMLTLALRFLPETIEQGKRILAAQQLRGAGGKGLLSAVRRFRLLVVPLLAVSLRSARQVAIAAEVRAYSGNRVPSKDLRFSVVDWAVMAGLVLLTVAGVAAAIIGHAAARGGIP